MIKYEFAVFNFKIKLHLRRFSSW